VIAQKTRKGAPGLVRAIMPIYGHNAIAGALGGNTGNIRAAPGGDRGLLWGGKGKGNGRDPSGLRACGLAGLRACGRRAALDLEKMFLVFITLNGPQKLF
jgi:hypothetical protein